MRVCNVIFRGKHLNLYNIDALAKALKVTPATIRNLEKSGDIPLSMFIKKQARWYSLPEIFAAGHVTSQYPCERKKKYAELTLLWGKIRKQLFDGIEPTNYPVFLHFATRDALKIFLEAHLRKIGVQSNQFVEHLTNKLIMEGL